MPDISLKTLHRHQLITQLTSLRPISPELDISPKPPPLGHSIVVIKVLDLLRSQDPPASNEICSLRVAPRRAPDQFIRQREAHNDQKSDDVLEEGVGRKATSTQGLGAGHDTAGDEQDGDQHHPDRHQRVGDRFPGVDLLEQWVVLGLERPVETPGGEGDDYPVDEVR